MAFGDGRTDDLVVQVSCVVLYTAPKSCGSVRLMPEKQFLDQGRARGSAEHAFEGMISTGLHSGVFKSLPRYHLNPEI